MTGAAVGFADVSEDAVQGVNAADTVADDDESVGDAAAAAPVVDLVAIDVVDDGDEDVMAAAADVADGDVDTSPVMTQRTTPGCLYFVPHWKFQLLLSHLSQLTIHCRSFDCTASKLLTTMTMKQRR